MTGVEQAEYRHMFTDSDGNDYDCEDMVDALDHIMRVTRQASTMTKRLKFVELRAKSALENTDEWQDYDYPTNREPTIKRMRVRAQGAEALLKRAKCPNSCSDGQYLVANDDWEYCQWCAERAELIGDGD